MSPLLPLKVAVFNDTSPTRHFGCASVMRELADLLRQRQVEIAWRHPVGIDWRPIADDVPRPPEIVAVIVNGEGSIHHSLTRPRAVYLAQLAAFAKDRLGVPSYLINATITDVEKDVLDSLRLFDAIYVRESLSQDELRRAAVETSRVPDLTLNVRWSETTTRGGVCGSDSVLKPVSAAIHDLCAAKGWDYRPMQLPKPSAGEPGPIPDPEDFLRFLSRHRLAITGRFHTATFCLVTRTPFVAVESNTLKISALCRDLFGSTRRVVSVDDLASLDIETWSRWTPEEEAALSAYLVRAKSDIGAMMDDVVASIRARSDYV